MLCVDASCGNACMPTRQKLMPGYINRMANIGSVILKVVPEKFLWSSLSYFAGAGTSF